MRKDTRDDSPRTDMELVSMSQAGDDNALAELISRYRPRCYKLAVSILRNEADAEDEIQNAFWKVYQHIGGFQQDAQFSTWLTRIVVNQCLMRLRGRKRSKLTYIEDVMAGDDGVRLDLPDGRETPEESWSRRQLAEVVRDEIRRIPPTMRTVIELKDLQQRDVADVAKTLGITSAAVKSRLLRARRELKTRLAKHMGQLGPATLLAESRPHTLR